MTLTQLFTDIANAIRTKTGGGSKITPSNFASEIKNIKTAPTKATLDDYFSANNWVLKYDYTATKRCIVFLHGTCTGSSLNIVRTTSGTSLLSVSKHTTYGGNFGILIALLEPGQTAHMEAGYTNRESIISCSYIEL